MTSCVIVVSRRWPELVQQLRGRHMHLDGVEVVLDRRERQVPLEGGTDRRAPPRLETDLERQAFAVVTQPWSDR
jgi:hypothetical protein